MNSLPAQNPAIDQTIRHDWTVDEIEAIYRLPLLELMGRASAVHRTHHDPNAVQKASLLSIKTGGCPEDCAYCPQSARYDTGVKAEKTMAVADVLAEAAQKAGVEKDAEFRRMLDLAKKKLMINAWAKQQFDKVIVSESEAKEFYRKHTDKFFMPERVHARHILLKDEKKAQTIIDQLKGLKGEALKKKFIELAQKESTGPTASKGGDLGYFTKSQMVLPFAKAAFALNPGQITPKPVKTQFGWHVIYVEDKKAAQKIPFDAVKDRVIGALKQQRFAQKMKQETELLKKNSSITIQDTGADKIKSPK